MRDPLDRMHQEPAERKHRVGTFSFVAYSVNELGVVCFAECIGLTNLPTESTILGMVCCGLMNLPIECWVGYVLQNVQTRGHFWVWSRCAWAYAAFWEGGVEFF